MFKKFITWLQEIKYRRLVKKRIAEARKKDPFIYK